MEHAILCIEKRQQRELMLKCVLCRQYALMWIISLMVHMAGQLIANMSYYPFIIQSSL